MTERRPCQFAPLARQSGLHAPRFGCPNCLRKSKEFSAFQSAFPALRPRHDGLTHTQADGQIRLGHPSQLPNSGQLPSELLVLHKIGFHLIAPFRV